MKTSSMHSSLRTAAALVTSALLAACGGSSSSSPQLPGNLTGAGTSGLTARIVGVGDSLMAGVQSNGLLGVAINPNPLPGSLFPIVPNTQGHGLYARIWAQANGGLDPLALATSPLPLMAAPGLGATLVPSSSGVPTPIGNPCPAGDNSPAFSYATALTTRLNPAATPLDVAVPGQTLHEALFQTQPTGSCTGTGYPAALAGLNSIVSSENQNFYPILGNFRQNITQVQAAVSLQPTLALVWLGSNDVLKYAGSNGGLLPTDPAIFQNDITQVITSLQHAGAKVAVANLVDVMGTAYFTPTSAASFQLLLAAQGIPAPLQAPIATAVGTFLQGYGVGAGGDLTLSGLGKVQAVLRGSVPAILGGAPVSAALAAGFAALQASASPFGAGDFVSDTVAATAKGLNAAYNTAILTATQQTGAALVDASALFAAAENAPGRALPVTGKCCSLYYGKGFFSLDGVHPSDTGYAVLTNLFITAIDGAYGAAIPPLTSAQIAAINATDLNSPH